MYVLMYIHRSIVTSYTLIHVYTFLQTARTGLGERGRGQLQLAVQDVGHLLIWM